MNRLDFAKLVVGGCLATLFAATVFGPLGFGMRYVDRLERRVHDDLDAHGLAGIEVGVVRTPSLRRDIVLSGNVSPPIRARALGTAQAVPGVASVRWATTTGGGGSSSMLSPTAGY